MVAFIPNDVFQFSTYTAVHKGFNIGQPRAADLTSHGTDGIGTFENGNLMTLLDGEVYTIDTNNHTKTAPLHEKLSFAMVTVFRPVRVVKSAKSSMSMMGMRELLGSSEVLPGIGGANSILPFKIRGTFTSLKLAGGEEEDHGGIEGTVFGFRVPAWLEGISGTELHCHFVGDETGSGKRVGAKVETFVVGGDAVIGVGKCGRFHLGFPQGEEWEGVELANAK